ncbi:hypothetical protein ACQKP0_00480 [Heyndrickxia sp. NPDC080065]|uniref:hypothetical protein n=1 Tax=Heyndrickxia sp. NPDC080065 TaxID=3390568 RepID=UPI003CFEAFBB
MKSHEEANEPLNEDDISMETVNQLVVNMNVETKIQILNEYQNNGQLANIIVNYIIPDLPVKSKKISSRILLTNIENNVNELKARQEEARGIVTSSIHITSKREQLYEDISDYLNINDSATLLTFYENLASFNDFLKNAEDYFQNNNIRKGIPMLDYSVNKISRTYEGQLHTIFDNNLDSLIERLRVLAT